MDWFPNLRPAYRLTVMFGGLTIVGAIAIAVVCVRREPLDAKGWYGLGFLIGSGVLGVALSIWYAATHEE
jgi:uncharacterized membrane protein HdeD (DUF308 family)